MAPTTLFSLAALTAAPDAAAIEDALRSAAGPAARAHAAAWIRSLIPVDWLVPRSAERWRPLVADALQFVFSRLSDGRLAQKIAEQMALPAEAPPEQRLMRLISRMPALQKIGQVLARNRRLAPRLRRALSELENGIRDVSHGEMREMIAGQLGERLEQFQVRLDSAILSEASVSAVIRFTWQNAEQERERGVFKALKPYVRACYGEEMELLQGLGRYLAGRDRGYGFAARDIDDMLTETRLLLERELDFEREQKTLAEATRTYRGTLGVRVPRVFPALCTAEITAMSEETGVKVTDAVRNSPVRQSRVAAQIVDALIATPLFSAQDPSVFHADPHAGNLLYDEANRELIVLDWALAERLSLDTRRRLILLAAMAATENRDGVREAIRGLCRPGRRGRTTDRIVDRAVDGFFERTPAGHVPGVLDAMRLLDQIALQGVRLAAPLFLFRKSLFTLDGVLRDVAGSDVRMDLAMMRHFLTRWAASFGLFYSPLRAGDLLSLEWNALMYPARAWRRKVLGAAG